MFQFTSIDGKVDGTINIVPGLYVFKMSGQNYHKLGSSVDGKTLKFAHLYIHDTENEVSNRMPSFNEENDHLLIERDRVEGLKNL